MKQTLLIDPVVEDAFYQQLEKAVAKSAYQLTDFGEQELTSSNLHFWKDLLLEVRSKKNEETGKKWARFNFLDYVWYKVLLYMNEMGISKDEKVKAIKYCLSQVTTNAPIDTGQDMGVINQNAYAGLSKVVTYSIFTTTSFTLTYYKDGRCQLFKDEQLVTGYYPANSVVTETSIHISLTDVFGDFIGTMLKALRAKEPLRLGIVSDEETTLLELIAIGVVTKFTVEYRGREPEHFMIEKVIEPQERPNIPLQVARQLGQYLAKHDYRKITYELAGGSRVPFVSKKNKRTV